MGKKYWRIRGYKKFDTAFDIKLPAWQQKAG